MVVVIVDKVVVNTTLVRVTVSSFHSVLQGGVQVVGVRWGPLVTEPPYDCDRQHLSVLPVPLTVNLDSDSEGGAHPA